LYADDNPLGLPAKQYELAFAIQDRSFNADGTLYYPAHNENFRATVHPAYLAFIEDNENNPTLTDPAFFPYPPNRGNDVNGGVSLMKHRPYDSNYLYVLELTYLALFLVCSPRLWQSSLETS
jgi:hypothetical protein